jgi:hypothetical protein
MWCIGGRSEISFLRCAVSWVGGPVSPGFWLDRVEVGGELALHQRSPPTPTPV